MRKLAFIILLTACGQQYRPFICKSMCGLELRHLPSDRWSCESLQQIEDAALLEFPNADDYRFQNTCRAFNGWSIIGQESDRVTTPDGRLVNAYTNIFATEVVLNNYDPDSSSLLHELAHVVQECSPNQCAHTKNDPAHQCWDVNLVDDAISRGMRRVRGEEP